MQSLLRQFGGRKGQPTAVCIDSQTLQSTPESGARAGYDGAKRRKGSKVHIALDTLGYLIALTVTPAIRATARKWRRLPNRCSRSPATRSNWPMSIRDTRGQRLPKPPCSMGIQLQVVKHPMAKRGFVLLPRRWVVERSFAWAARFRRLARDYERLDTTLKGSTTSASPASCSQECSTYLTQRHNRL